MDVNDNFSISGDNLVNRTQDFSSKNYSIIVNDKGEVLAHPIEPSDLAVDIFQTSYYASSLDDDFVPSGGGPGGTIYYSEESGLVVLITSDHEIYYKDRLEVNFIKLEIVNRDFSEIQTATFDNQSRLIITAGYGRILRFDLSNLPGAQPFPNPKKFTLYPNPAEESMSIKFDAELSGEFLIYNTSGQLIMRNKFNGKRHNINISELPIGVYFLELKEPSQNKRPYKFVKM